MPEYGMVGKCRPGLRLEVTRDLSLKNSIRPVLFHAPSFIPSAGRYVSWEIRAGIILARLRCLKVGVVSRSWISSLSPNELKGDGSYLCLDRFEIQERVRGNLAPSPTPGSWSPDQSSCRRCRDQTAQQKTKLVSAILLYDYCLGNDNNGL
mgnify:CR=1 FL=1